MLQTKSNTLIRCVTQHVDERSIILFPKLSQAHASNQKFVDYILCKRNFRTIMLKTVCFQSVCVAIHSISVCDKCVVCIGLFTVCAISTEFRMKENCCKSNRQYVFRCSFSHYRQRDPIEQRVWDGVLCGCVFTKPTKNKDERIHHERLNSI